LHDKKKNIEEEESVREKVEWMKVKTLTP
jgi:hypothetical protein